jgi:hypothetical protein
LFSLDLRKEGKKRFLSSLMNPSVPVDRDLLLQWYEVRDTLLGRNLKKQDIAKALTLAAASKHEDAQWLVSFCARHNYEKVGGLGYLFLKEPNDRRALCFAAAFAGDETLMRRSASLGYAFAQAYLANAPRSSESLQFAQLAANQGERDGFRRLNTKESLLRAIDLGCIESMSSLAQLLPQSDPERFYWLGKAASFGASLCFCSDFPKEIRLFLDGHGRSDVAFAIGQALDHGHVNFELRKIFNIQYSLDALLAPARQAIAFFRKQIQAARQSVRLWTLIAIRLRIIKDIRKLIGEIIWAGRSEGTYPFSSQDLYL